MRILPFVAALAFLAPVAARAGDPPAPPPPPAVPAPTVPTAPAAPEAPPKPRPRITHPYLASLVGSWDLVARLPDGEHKGTSTFALVLDGTALVEEMTADNGFRGLGVWYVGEDPATVRLWWFDSMGAGGVWAQSGALGATACELKGEGLGGATASLRQDGAGQRYEMSKDGKPVLSIRYTKAATPAKREVVAREKGPACALVDDVLGDWTIDGVTLIDYLGVDVRHAGTASFRLGVGGSYLLLDYDAKSAMDHMPLYGVLSFGADGKTATYWWFTSTFDGPVRMAGTTDGKAWTFVANKTPVGDVTSVWTAKDGGLRTTDEIVQPGDRRLSVSETYTRKK